jgi:hypothetical protein
MEDGDLRTNNREQRAARHGYEQIVEREEHGRDGKVGVEHKEQGDSFGRPWSADPRHPDEKTGRGRHHDHHIDQRAAARPSRRADAENRSDTVKT